MFSFYYHLSIICYFFLLKFVRGSEGAVDFCRGYFHGLGGLFICDILISIIWVKMKNLTVFMWHAGGGFWEQRGGHSSASTSCDKIDFTISNLTILPASSPFWYSQLFFICDSRLHFWNIFYVYYVCYIKINKFFHVQKLLGWK